MTWIFPLALGIGAVGVLAAIAAHFFARTSPEPAALPTARFIPPSSASATRPARRPTDLLLLALRVLAIAAVAAAFAGPIFARDTPATALIVVVDRTASVADSAEVADTVARLAEGHTGPFAVVDMSAGLTQGLIGARRAAAGLATEADSAELVIVSAFDAALLDEATAVVRREWPGAARLIPVSHRGAEPGAHAVDATSLPADDPLLVTVRMARLDAAGGTRAPVRFARGQVLSPADTTALRGGATVVHWPTAAGDDSLRPRAMVIARGGRAAPSGESDGPPASATPLVVTMLAAGVMPDTPGAAIARWEDGSVAATAVTYGHGCLVSVGARPVLEGDLPIREDFRALVRALAAGCGRDDGGVRLDATTMEILAGNGARAELVTLRAGGAAGKRVSVFLLLLAAAALLVELLARRRVRA